MGQVYVAKYWPYSDPVFTDGFGFRDIIKDGHTIQDFFIITTASAPTPESIQVMHGWNVVATTLVLAAIVLYGLIFSYQKKTGNSKSERS